MKIMINEMNLAIQPGVATATPGVFLAFSTGFKFVSLEARVLFAF